MSKLEIQVLKKKSDKQYEPPKTHPDLPQLHFAACVVGPRGTGKSLMIRNLLLRDDMLKRVFKKPNYIIIISPSLFNGDYDEIEGDNVYKFDFYDQEMVDKLIEVQSDIIKKHGKKRCPSLLVVMDDVLDSGALDFHSKIEKIYSRGRHVHINCILVSQHMNRISRTIRLNSSYMFFFRPYNLTELQHFLEQYVQKKYWYGMEEYLKNMWAENHYQFILVDFVSNESGRRYRKGFSEPIDIDSFPSKPSKKQQAGI